MTLHHKEQIKATFKLETQQSRFCAARNHQRQLTNHPLVTHKNNRTVF